MKFLLGRKIGMTRLFDERGASTPVTVIEAGPCRVVQMKTVAKDGYEAVQIGLASTRQVAKSEQGHLARSGLKGRAVLVESRLSGTEGHDLEVGQTLDVTAFTPGDQITVVGTSKGKGYQGVVKRHGFAGGPASHGSDFHRAAGAIGGRWPQRVVKGRRMAGHMGHDRVTVKNLRILQIDQEHNLLAISGAIPGPRRSLVEIRG